jgi:Lon protease-like protein
LDALNLAKIICVISPLDHLTKQMLLEFNNSDDLCENLISVLEIEINNFGKSSKIN